MITGKKEEYDLDGTVQTHFTVTITCHTNMGEIPTAEKVMSYLQHTGNIHTDLGFVEVLEVKKD
jgi:hypothetical protein